MVLIAEDASKSICRILFCFFSPDQIDLKKQTEGSSALHGNPAAKGEFAKLQVNWRTLCLVTGEKIAAYQPP